MLAPHSETTESHSPSLGKYATCLSGYATQSRASERVTGDGMEMEQGSQWAEEEKPV